MFCLPVEEAKKIKEAIRSGYLNPERLNSMTSQERRVFLAGIIGKENAKQVNLLFEKKVLLKNQERAMYDWARQITGMSREQKEATLEKIRATYAEKKRRLENPAESEKFLNEIISDVYSRKYKTEVTLEEAENIINLTQDVKLAKDKLGDISKWKTEDFVLTGSKESALQFGAVNTALTNYLSRLKLEAQKQYLINPFKVKGFMPKLEALSTDAAIAVNFIADNSRAIVASIDNSFWGRQGIKTIFIHPVSWAKNFIKSFNDLYVTITKGTKAGDALIDAGKAIVFARENYMKGRYENKGGAKLDIGGIEEEFPTSAPTKIPALGRVFKAAEVAYELGALRLRTDIADLEYKLAEQNGIDMKNKNEIGSINLRVNSMTGRGRLPLAEEGPLGQKAINKAFFSIKFAKSNIDTLTVHAFDKDFTPYARKKAAYNLVQIAAGMAIILAIADALDDDSVEWDSASANFGKIKLGNIRFDITGGMSAFLILASRLAKGYTKSSVTGIITPLSGGFGGIQGMDLLWDFVGNKFSPLASVVKELVNRETFEGEKPTLVNQLKNLTLPIIIEEGMNAKDKENLADTLLVLIAEAIGISANVYSYSSNWEVNPGKQLEQFKDKVGDKKFKEANELYNERVSEMIEKKKTEPKYMKLSDEKKQTELTKEKSKIKKRIFIEYRFKYNPNK